MQTLAALNESFAIPGVLAFDDPYPGMICARITTAACTAEIFLHGAHLTQWQPSGAKPVPFLSPLSAYTPEKVIRGGVPVIFPWFGARTEAVTGNRTGGPQHGFARTETWQVAFAALAGENLHLTLTLGPSDESRSAGFDHFRVALEFVVGSTLTLRLTVANESEDTPLRFEEALHSYFAVGDVKQARIHGLAETEYLDKMQHFERKRQLHDPLTIHGETDRPYLNTAATVTIEDPALSRRITIAKSGSQTTVVWNPWGDLTAKLADLEPDAWQHFVCVEIANVADNLIKLAPRSAHVMEAHISVTRTAEAPRA